MTRKVTRRFELEAITRKFRALLPQVLVLVLVVLVAPSAGARDGVPVLVVDGLGHGHGVGMAQDGAFWMAKAGASTNDILGHFYPDTSMSGPAGGEVRVPVHDTGRVPGAAEVAFPNGGEIRDTLDGEPGDGFPVAIAPGGAVYLNWDGQRYWVDGGQPTWRSSTVAAASLAAETTTTSTSTSTSTTTTTTTTLVPTSTTTTTTTAPPTTAPAPAPPPPPPSRQATSGRSLWAVPSGGGTVTVPIREFRTYRGTIEATAVGGPLRLVNHVDVETYLKGMAEVRDPTWPVAALQVQAIAARTYALRAMRIAGEICDTQRCQVYVGAAAEYGAMNGAVDATRGQVITYEGRLASAVYSSNAGGNTASPEEGFGTSNNFAPYLRPGPYLTHDAKPWTVEVALTDVADRLGYPGEVRRAGVGRFGPSGRALEVVIGGSAGDMVVDGLTFDESLGLRSTFVVGLRTGVAAVAPDAPPGRTVLQRPPGHTEAPAPSTSAATAGDPTMTAEVAAAWPGGRIAAGAPTRPTPLSPQADVSGVVFYSVVLLGLAAAGWWGLRSPPSRRRA
jgi:SpoIID/LytB domain protein